MTKQLSYTKYEHKILHNFRPRLNKAESTEDLKKFFFQTLKELLEDIFGEKIKFRYEDFDLQPENDPCYTISDRILSSENIKSVWNESDLSQVIQRLAESAAGRYKHLKKKPERTDAKIRM